MTTRTFLKISSATLFVMCAAVPAHADPAMDACIDTFVAEHVPKDRALKIRKLGSTSAASAKREERVLLTAKGARSGTSIATAICVVSGDGQSVALYAEGATLTANAH